MNRIRIILISLVLCLGLAACGGSGTPQISGATAEVPTEIPAEVNPATALPPTPETGKATVLGKVVSIEGGEPLANTTVRLAEVYWQGDEGAFVLDGANSPGDITDEQGNFFIPSIDAREYVIVVGDVYSVYEIIAEPSGKGKVWKVAADEILDVGSLTVDLTQ
jgi:hypothetical protein